MISFEFDETKSRTNLEKHGIDFIEAQSLWNDFDLVEIPVKTPDEPRYLIIAKHAGKHWSGVITYRGQNVRIISVRRSRKQEVEYYELSRI